MAHDTHEFDITITVRSPDYEFTGVKQFGEHKFNNGEQKRAICDAILEQINNTMPIVIADGEEFVVESVCDEVRLSDGNTEVHLNDDEQALFDQQAQTEKDGWNEFHAEIDRRVRAEDTDLFDVGRGIYSMGDLSGPISQLDELAGVGLARVVINDGWGDSAPVYSTSVILNPTNWDMFRMFCQALAQSNDDHHVFLEGIQYLGTDEDDVAIFKAMTSS